MTTRADPLPIENLSAERRLLLSRLLAQRQGETEPSVPRPSAAGPAAGDGRLGVSLFFFSADLDGSPEDRYGLLLECAELADELGLEAIWVPERHFDPFGAPYPSPAQLLAAVAARTHRVQLRAGSVVLPLHDPLLVAEEWGVLDALSGGRVGLSLASGWHAEDFVLNPSGYARRKEILRERLETLRVLWSGGAVSRPGPADEPVAVRTYPRPGRQPEVWLTSSVNAETWRTAGELGLHVLTALLEQTTDELAGKAGLYQRTLAEHGHAVESRRVTCMLHTHVAVDPATVEQRVREPLTRYLAAHLELFAKFAARGELPIRPTDVSAADRRALLEHGLQRYLRSAGLFGTVESCQPMMDRLAAAGVTEVGCLVDFGLGRADVLECVRELGALAAHERARTPRSRPTLATEELS